MLMEAVRWLRESGLKVEDHASASDVDMGAAVILDVSADGRSTRFAVQVKGRAPYPHEVEQLSRSWDRLAGLGRPLMIAPFISEPLGPILTGAGWSWADDQGNFDLRAPGLLFRQRRTATAPSVGKRRSLPRGSGSFAVIRALVAFCDGEDEEPARRHSRVRQVSRSPGPRRFCDTLLIWISSKEPGMAGGDLAGRPCSTGSSLNIPAQGAQSNTATAWIHRPRWPFARVG